MAWTCANTLKRTGSDGVSRASSTPNPTKASCCPYGPSRTKRPRASAGATYARFLEYREEEDFVGMDVARKFLQMGWTRSRRYVKYRGGKKSELREEPGAQKQRAAEVFYEKWRAAENGEYLRLKEEHRRRNA